MICGTITGIDFYSFGNEAPQLSLVVQGVNCNGVTKVTYQPNDSSWLMQPLEVTGELVLL